MSIRIPVFGADEVVEVSLDALPDDANELIDVLKGETATLDVWLHCALAYYAAGRAEQGRAVLDESCEIPGDIFPDAKADRVSLLTASAGHCINAALTVADKRARLKLLDQAAQFFARADTVDLSDPRIWLGRGFLNLHRGELPKARAAFEQALRERPAEPLGVLGLACAAYGSASYLEALRLFRQLMTSCAEPPPGVRLGLGLCYAQLKQPSLARRCFERALELDSGDGHAAIALALTEINDWAEPASVRSGLERLAELHRADPANPHVLNQLAAHFFYAREFDMVEKLARQAYQSAPSARVRAESYWHLARCQHVKGAWAGAKQFYMESAKNAPTFMLAQYGLGLMHARAHEHLPALEALNKVTKAHPMAPEPLRVLARLQLDAGLLPDAERSLERLVALNAADAEAWGLLAQVRTRAGAAAAAHAGGGGAAAARAAEAARLQSALEAYAQAVDACRARRQPTPPALWNNLGVLRARLGKAQDAEEALLRALKLAGAPQPAAGGGEAGPAGALPLAGVQVTCTYNLARLLEMNGELARAEEKYTAIARAHPTYADAFVGLASCALARGQRADAEARLRQASELNPAHADTRCLLGRLHAGAREWHRAKQAFDAVLRDGATDDRRDAYAMVSVANILVATASRQDEPAKPDRALELYSRVLAREPTNMFAAQGVGVVLADKGYLQEAKEIFTLVLEAGGGPELCSAAANLAHIHMLENRPLLAIKLYENCLRHAATSQLALSLQLAHAQYRANMLLECKRTLAGALHAHPGSAPLWYHICTNTNTKIKTQAQKHTHTHSRLYLALTLLQDKDK
ncbi:hypothetical protein T492DRAFT_592674 [Pavlovales sp. CCMP2436]|nr:hypothetical protein T492DRAFT_592674 [Pavlovales sp. CCMP2436]